MNAKGGIMVCKLKGRIEKGEHYDVELKWFMKQGAI